MNAALENSDLPETKRLLVDAGILLMRQKGYNATTVDDVCAEAKVTKGAFFHYFKSKEDLARAALERFGKEMIRDLNDAPFRKLTEPMDRLNGRLDFIKQWLGGEAGMTNGCLIGTLAQELSLTNPGIRVLCHEMLLAMARDFAEDLAAAKSAHPPGLEFDPEKLAILFSSIYQGSSLLAKSSGSNAVLMENIEQFRTYLKSLFRETTSRRTVQPMEALDIALD